MNSSSPAIYIDDTGTSQQSKSKYINGNLSSYVAVVLNANQRENISKAINNFRLLFSDEFELDEFHFTEIFSGKKKFRKVNIDLRLKIFETFANIYNKYNCPIYIQSLTDEDVIRNEMEDWRGFKKDGFNFSKNSHLCLWFLLVRLKNKELINSYELPFEIYVDSGKQEPNTNQKVDILNQFAKNSEIQYLDSKADPLIQFIDFIAFTLNRCRWILMNNKKSETDFKFLNIAELANFNTVNMLKLYANAKVESTTDIYDKILREEFDKDGNLSDEELEKRKRNRQF